jgi:alkylation response protein AidB-like acyl-CoA dehydrogenase
VDEPATTLRRASDAFVLGGEKVAVEQLELASRLVVCATFDGESALVLVPARDSRVVAEARDSFDATLAMAAIRFEDATVAANAVITGSAARDALERLTAAGSLLAAAEAIGAARRVLDEACRYAVQRRQFGRPIGSFQALRHVLADMHVRAASGWSTVLYAAAAFDDGAEEAGQTASIAKAYVSRGAREVAHGAMQVFGGIAFTAEHPAHRWLRRIIVREQQFGDAAHHERALGRELAARRLPTTTAPAQPTFA